MGVFKKEYSLGTSWWILASLLGQKNVDNPRTIPVGCWLRQPSSFLIVGGFFFNLSFYLTHYLASAWQDQPSGDTC